MDEGILLLVEDQSALLMMDYIGKTKYLLSYNTYIIQYIDPNSVG